MKKSEGDGREENGAREEGDERRREGIGRGEK